MATKCVRISGTPNIKTYLDTSATAAYVAGDLVRLDASGTLVIATDGAATASAGFLGIAMADSPASTSVRTPVDIISSDGSEFVMKNSGTSAEADNGHYFAVTCTTTAVTVAKGSGGFVQTGLWDAAGSGGKIIGKFVAADLQSEVGYA